jgi:hypothetical protein
VVNTAAAAMTVWSRRLLPLAIAAMAALTAVTALARTTRGRLTGTWSGYIVGDKGSHVRRRHIVIIVNAKETNVYDAVTSHLGGEYDASGTLRRVQRR